MASAWEKTQEQYQRKLERQRKLEELEQIGGPQSPEASLQPSFASDKGSTVASITTTAPHTMAPILNSSSSTLNSDSLQSSTRSNGNGGGAIDNARRFLWEEEEGLEAGHGNSGVAGAAATPAAVYNPDSVTVAQETEMLRATTIQLHDVRQQQQPLQQQQQQQKSGMLSVMANKLMAWNNAIASDPRAHPDSRQARSINIAARRPSFSMHGDDGTGGNKSMANGTEEDGLRRRHHPYRNQYLDQPKARYSPLQNCFYIVADNVYEAHLWCQQHIYEPASKRLASCCGGRVSLTAASVGACLGVLLLILVLVPLSVHRHSMARNSSRGQDANHDATPGTPLPSERYHKLVDLVTLSGFADADTIGNDPIGAQNLALLWLADQDPAQLPLDHGALLQRYALAVLFLSSYTDSMQSNKNNTDDTDIEYSEWMDDTFWMSGKGICMWIGVRCAPHLHNGVPETSYNENAAVLGLNLTANGLRGTIPTELIALENLESLDLGQNRLRGTIPDVLTDTLPFLRELYLQDNQLTGTIPRQWAGASRMKDLFLGGNMLTGTIPTEVSYFHEMRALALNDNALTGTIPPLGNMTDMSECTCGGEG